MKRILTLTVLIVALLVSTTSTKSQFSYIGSYNWSGKPDYLLQTDADYSDALRAKIAITLPERRPVPIYNPRLISQGRPETISLTTDAEVWITFIDEGASYRNALAYYTYPTDAPLKKAPAEKDIKIIFPNASKPGAGGDLNGGSKVYLGKFPANTSIAYALIVDGWNDTNVSYTKGILYANAAFNPEANDSLKKHTVMLNEAETGKIIIGFEDTRRDYTQCDHDFNDVLFYTTVSPRSAVAHSDSIPDLTKDGNVVYSGNTGGLESKSLGDIIGKRMLNKYKSGANGAIDYSLMSKVVTAKKTAIFGTANTISISNLAMTDIMPERVYDSGYTAYFTSPNDITSFTNATQVTSIDFVKDTSCNAVAFTTKSSGEVYAHTKPVCDRLRGSQIISIENFSLQGLTFVRYALKRPSGNIEYATSFSIGTKTGRNSFSFQSNWLTKDYVNDETMYNYQFWASKPYLVTDMMIEVLTKLKAIAPVERIAPASTLPVAYIKAAKRDNSKLAFTVNNTSTESTGYFEVDEKTNEQADIQTKVYAFAMSATGLSTVNIDVNDAYEHNIRMVVNGKVQDLLYMSDGNWAIDYNKATTTLNNFTVTNAPAANYTTDLPVYRSVHIEATTSSYVSVYKLLMGGGATQNLNDYKTIHFNANGGNNLRITILKNSITNWNDQYTISVPLATESKDYAINLADFKSTLNQASLDLSDVTTIVFSVEIPTGTLTNVNATFSNIGFSKATEAAITNATVSKEVVVYPNPSNGKFNLTFQSAYQSTYIVNVSDIATGRLVFSKNIQSLKGNNNIPVDITNQINGNSVYIVTVINPNEDHINKRILIKK